MPKKQTLAAKTAVDIIVLSVGMHFKSFGCRTPLVEQAVGCTGSVICRLFVHTEGIPGSGQRNWLGE